MDVSGGAVIAVAPWLKPANARGAIGNYQPKPRLRHSFAPNPLHIEADTGP